MERAQPMNGVRSKRPFQFRLVELFVAVTAFALCFAMIGWWDVEGFKEWLWAAFSVASVCAGIMEIHYRIKDNLGQ